MRLPLGLVNSQPSAATVTVELFRGVWKLFPGRSAAMTARKPPRLRVFRRTAKGHGLHREERAVTYAFGMLSGPTVELGGKTPIRDFWPSQAFPANDSHAPVWRLWNFATK